MIARSTLLISLTSVPQRFLSSLPKVLAALQQADCRILVSIPEAYRKWGACSLPESLLSLRNVDVFRPSRDFGPATKLLGALEYVRDNRRYEYILTLDDDGYYRDTGDFVDYMLKQASVHPGEAITIGGIRLTHWPYARRNGLCYNNIGYVDAVAGYRGVLYPVAPLLRDERIFTGMSNLPSGIFHDDDAYFGIMLAILGVPVHAIEEYRGGGYYVKLEEGGESAVQAHAETQRVANESLIYRFAVSRGMLPSPFVRHDLRQQALSALRGIAQRFRLVSRRCWRGATKRTSGRHGT